MNRQEWRWWLHDWGMDLLDLVTFFVSVVIAGYVLRIAWGLFLLGWRLVQ